MCKNTINSKLFKDDQQTTPPSFDLDTEIASIVRRDVNLSENLKELSKEDIFFQSQKGQLRE